MACAQCYKRQLKELQYLILEQDENSWGLLNLYAKGPFKYYVIKRMGGWGKPNDYAVTEFVCLIRFDYRLGGWVQKGQNLD